MLLEKNSSNLSLCIHIADFSPPMVSGYKRGCKEVKRMDHAEPHSLYLAHLSKLLETLNILLKMVC